MIVYCTSRNNYRFDESDTVDMVYLGTSVGDAEKAVGKFLNYIVGVGRFPANNFRDAYCALPPEIPREMIQFYMSGGQWYSIVMFDLKEKSNV